MRVFSKWLLTFSAVLAGVFGLIGMYSFVTYRPLTPGDFTAVEGKVRRATEERVSGSPLSGTKTGLDIYLEEGSVRFRVPDIAYEGPFKRDEFRSNVHPGSPVVIEVETAQLHNPIITFRDPKPTVWVAGIHDAGTVYYSLDDKRKWQEENHRSMLYLGAFFSVAAVFLAFRRKVQLFS